MVDAPAGLGARAARTIGLASLAIAWGASCGAGGGAKVNGVTAGASSSASTSASTANGGSLTSSASSLAGGRARVVMLPSDAWVGRDVLDLGVAKLLVGNGGERWLAKDAVPTPASSLAPEDLVAARRVADGTFVFLGASGAVYTAKDATSALLTARAAPASMRSVAAGEHAFLGITDAGAMLRTVDAGVSWTPVTTPKLEGALVQLAMAHAGRGLALVAPERLLVTVDDGASFAPLASIGLGAQRLGVDPHDDVFVEGMMMDVSKDGAVTVRGGPASILQSAPTLHLQAQMQGPRAAIRLTLPDDWLWLDYATAINEGRGAIVGSTYFQVIPDGTGGEEEKLLLATRTADTAVTSSPIPKLLGCQEQWLAAHGKHLAVGCALQADAGEANERWILKVVRSDDAGSTWTQLGTLEWNDDSQVRRLFVSGDGTVLVAGACAAPRTDACGVTGAMVRAPGSASFTQVKFSGPAAPSLQRIASSDDGKRIYALGMADGDDQLSRLISKDSGKSFIARALPMIDEATVTDALELVVEEPQKAGATPTVTALTIGAPTNRYVTSDDGVTIDAHAITLDANTVSLAGQRGLALGYVGPQLQGYETIDGGVTWGAVTLPLGHDRADVANLACSKDLCAIGERALRVGWDFERADEVKAAVAIAPPARATVNATPLRCTTSGETLSLGAVEGLQLDPGAGAAWSLMKRDLAKGAVSVLLQAKKASALSPKETALLSPTSGDVASFGESTTEGVASARYAFKRDPPKAKAKLGAITAKQIVDVEVAWYVASTGKVHHGTIKGAGPLDPGRYTVQALDGTVRAKAAAWIAPGAGLYVRPFSSKGSEDLYLVSESGKVTKLPPSPLPMLSLTAVRDGVRTTFVGNTNDGNGSRQIFLASLADGETSWTTRWWGAWPRAEGSVDVVPTLSTASIGAAPFELVAFPGSAHVPAATWAISLASPASGPTEVISLATQRDLGDPPRACDAASSSLPRVVLPFVTGSRHPVMIKDDARALSLATWDVVARTSKVGPACASSWLVSRPSSIGGDLAAIGSDELEHATLFTEKTDATGRTMTARAMSCAPSNEPLPSAYSGAKGFSR